MIVRCPGHSRRGSTALDVGCLRLVPVRLDELQVSREAQDIGDRITARTMALPARAVRTLKPRN